MLCPNCDHDNIAGVDLCEACGSDLAGLDLPEAQSGVAGRLLTDRVGDLPLAPRVEVRPDERVNRVIERMRDERLGYALVVDGDRLVGIFTERDVIARVVSAGIDPAKTEVGQVMTESPSTLSHRDPPAYAVHRMLSQSFRHLPITDGRTLLGLLSIRGVLRYLYVDVLGGHR